MPDNTAYYLSLFKGGKTRDLSDEEWHSLNPLLGGMLPRGEITYAHTRTSGDVVAQVPVGTATVESRYLAIPTSSLAHEATHILQNEPISRGHDDPSQMRDTWPVISDEKDKYNYGGPRALTAYHKLGVPITAFSREQQASIVQHYFDMQQHLKTYSSPDSQDVIAGHIYDRTGMQNSLPSYAHYMQQIKNATIQRQEGALP